MRLALTAAALALTIPVMASAQGSGPATQIDPNHLRANQLIDRDIYTTDNKEIGEVEDLVIDPATGRVVTTVIEVESRLGLTDKYVSVPLDQLRLTPGERRVTINLTEEQVKALPGINYRD